MNTMNAGQPTYLPDGILSSEPGLDPGISSVSEHANTDNQETKLPHYVVDTLEGTELAIMICNTYPEITEQEFSMARINALIFVSPILKSMSLETKKDEDFEESEDDVEHYLNDPAVEIPNIEFYKKDLEELIIFRISKDTSGIIDKQKKPEFINKELFNGSDTTSADYPNDTMLYATADILAYLDEQIDFTGNFEIYLKDAQIE